MTNLDMISLAVNVLPAILEVAAGIFVLVLAQTRAMGGARTAGVVGAGLIIAGVVIPTISSLVLNRQFEMESLTTVYTLLFIQNTVRVLLLGAGLVALVRCVVLSHRTRSENSSWQGNPAGMPYAPGPLPGPDSYNPGPRSGGPSGPGQVRYPDQPGA